MTARIIRPALFATVLLLIVAGLAVWHGMAFYPDEIAFRMQLGRFIQDKGIVEGLYALCASGHKVVPWLFVPSAWLLSLMDLSLDPAQMRMVSLISVLGCLAMTAYYGLRQGHNNGFLWLGAAIVGVAGSSLVFARYESILFFNLMLCIYTLHLLSQGNIRTVTRIGLSCALAFAAICSLYIHLQGMVYLPLTAYLIYRLNNNLNIHIPKIILCVLGVVGAAYVTRSFYDLSCPGHPEIEAFWNKMLFHWDGMSWNIVEVMATKLSVYLNAFTYNPAYPSEYLPALAPDMQNASLNALIQCVVATIFGLNIIVAAVLGVSLLRALLFRQPLPFGLSVDGVLVYGMVYAPTFLLFIYDTAQNFYRSIVLNLLFCVALVLILSSIQTRYAKKIISAFGVVICSVAIGSLVANMHLFYPRISQYEGPSIANTTNWSTMRDEVSELAQQCAIDITAGKGVIDDYSYDVVKQYQHIYPITYLGLQAGITKMTVGAVLDIVKPGYVLASCVSMEKTGIGWPARARKGNLCCTKFNDYSQGKK